MEQIIINITADTSMLIKHLQILHYFTHFTVLPILKTFQISQ